MTVSSPKAKEAPEGLSAQGLWWDYEADMAQRAVALLQVG